MRLAILALALCAASVASADRLISTPTGRKIPNHVVRFEAMAELSRGRTQEYFAGTGLGTSFDLEVRSQRLNEADAQATFDLGYNYIAPVPGISPGLSLGVQDALDRTVDGRRYYAAVAYRPTFSTINGDYAADVNLGFYLGRHASAFVGVSLPFSREFRILAEHNGRRLASGIEVRPSRTVALRLLAREQDILGSVVLTHRF